MELTVATILVAFAGVFLICFMKERSVADSPSSAFRCCRS
jgi:hypothetical protein